MRTSRRRTLYGLIDRRNLPEIYNQFDFANPDITSGKRYETTVPQQALFMMNSPLVVEQARNLVNRSDFQGLDDAEARIKYLYERIFQRLPSEVEIKLAADRHGISQLRVVVFRTDVRRCLIATGGFIVAAEGQVDGREIHPGFEIAWIFFGGLLE